jgi:hypothetical protein
VSHKLLYHFLNYICPNRFWQANFHEFALKITLFLHFYQLSPNYFSKNCNYFIHAFQFKAKKRPAISLSSETLTFFAGKDKTKNQSLPLFWGDTNPSKR